MFALNFGNDTISQWAAGDKISLAADLGVAEFGDLDSDNSNVLDAGDDLVDIAGSDTVLTFVDGDTLTVEGTTDLGASDFLFA